MTVSCDQGCWLIQGVVARVGQDQLPQCREAGGRGVRDWNKKPRLYMQIFHESKRKEEEPGFLKISGEINKITENEKKLKKITFF